MTKSDKPRDQDKDDKSKKPERSLLNRPKDANQTGADKTIPPGVGSRELHDPGSVTPNAPPVDNRS